MVTSSHQVTATHGDTCPEPEGLLQVALQGTPHRVTGTVQGSSPVLRELNGATFKQPAPLVGPLLIYRAKASETNALPTLTGKLLVSPQWVCRGTGCRFGEGGGHCLWRCSRTLQLWQ